MSLPAPISAPRALPGVRHAYPYTREEFAALSMVVEGEQFLWRGDHYLATGSARLTRRNGFEALCLTACRRNGVMRSGWELADVTASVREGAR